VRSDVEFGFGLLVLNRFGRMEMEKDSVHKLPQ
jgi:hypothetical protein